MKSYSLQTKNHQRGAVLILAIVFLALTAMISSSVLYTGALETKMVGNAQFKEEAFQVAEGAVDAIVSDYSNTLPVTGGIGFTVCAPGDSDSSCNNFSLNVPQTVTTVPTGVSLTYRAQRMGPLDGGLPFVPNQEIADSAESFKVAVFEVQSVYDGRDVKLGFHEVVHGVGIKYSASN